MKSGGLARAVRTDETDDCALRNGKRNVLNRRKFTKGLGQVPTSRIISNSRLSGMPAIRLGAAIPGGRSWVNSV